MLAIEQAMDELAYKLGIDPVELRLRNEPEADPETGKARSRPASWSSCMQEGAAGSAGTSATPRPGSATDGRWLVGLGHGARRSAATILLPGEAPASRMDGDGTVTVERT